MRGPIRGILESAMVTYVANVLSSTHVHCADHWWRWQREGWYPLSQPRALQQVIERAAEEWAASGNLDATLGPIDTEEHRQEVAAGVQADYRLMLLIRRLRPLLATSSIPHDLRSPLDPHS